MRLGWITTNKLFADKLEIFTDSSTQQPHGFGQVLAAEMLSPAGWGFNGYFKWIKSLCDDYQRRRDLFVEVFEKGMAGKPFAKVDRPSAGMFMWIEIVYEHHPSFSRSSNATPPTVEAFIDDLFQKIFDAGVLVMPAKTFAIMSEGADSMNVCVFSSILRLVGLTGCH